MNERIKQLAEQAGILKEQSVQAKIVKNEDGTWTSILEYPDLEKFAELIVRECAQACINMGNEYEIKSAGQYQAELFAFAIKQHFGVEE
jgi:hypothetical protein